MSGVGTSWEYDLVYRVYKISRPLFEASYLERLNSFYKFDNTFREIEDFPTKLNFISSPLAY